MRALRRWVVALLLPVASGHADVAYGAGWVAFLAPDQPQTRRIFEQMKARAKGDLEGHALDMRFVPLPMGEGPEADALVQQAIAGAPTVVIATNTRTAQSSRRATRTIPIIFASFSDPVREGLVESLARPGGNATGFTNDVLVEGKQLQILAEIAPRARVIGVLEDGHWLGERITAEQLGKLEGELGKSIRVFRAGSKEEFLAIPRGAAAKGVDAWLVPISNYAGEQQREVVRLFREIRRPVVYGRGFFVEAGGLAAYQEVISDPVGVLTSMLQLVLKGVPPSSIPVQRPKEFELSVNTAAARAIGIELPATLLKRANRVVGAN